MRCFLAAMALLDHQFAYALWDAFARRDQSVEISRDTTREPPFRWSENGDAGDVIERSAA